MERGIVGNFCFEPASRDIPSGVCLKRTCKQSFLFFICVLHPSMTNDEVGVYWLDLPNRVPQTRIGTMATEAFINLHFENDITICYIKGENVSKYLFTITI